MEPTLLGNTLVVSHLPGTRYMALMCCAGSAGEAAFSNSLDEQFVEVGYAHLPLTLGHRRPPTYHVKGTSIVRGVVTHRYRIARSQQNITNPPRFHHAEVINNASTVCLTLNAVTLDLSHLTSLQFLPT